MTKIEKFWLVWSPTGTLPPRHRHTNEASANTEACRLAGECRGHEFFVLEANCLAKAVDVQLVDLETGDDIPF